MYLEDYGPASLVDPGLEMCSYYHDCYELCILGHEAYFENHRPPSLVVLEDQLL